MTMVQATPLLTREEESVRTMLQRPIVLGASVSADWGSPSPGKQLALRYASAPLVRTLAQAGRPGLETMKVVKESDFQDRTIVLAVDLFFWDSTLAHPNASLSALGKIVKLAADRNLPLVLGEIPELLPGRQPSRTRLNQEIAKACAQYARSYLMPFDQLHQQVVKEGLMVGGQKRSLQELLPDGLHLSPLAAGFLAEILLGLLTPSASQ